LDATDRTFKAIKKHHGRVFLIWTSDSALSLLRNPDPAALSSPTSSCCSTCVRLCAMRHVLTAARLPSIRGTIGRMRQRHVPSATIFSGREATGQSASPRCRTSRPAL
jgi:hypothetical protein